MGRAGAEDIEIPSGVAGMVQPPPSNLRPTPTPPRGVAVSAMNATRKDVSMNREHLLRAAADFVSRRPAATQDEIAAAVGVSRATLHRQFSGREALLEALDRLAISELRAALETSGWHEGSPVDGLRRLVGACEPVAGYVALLHARNEAAESRQSRGGWEEITAEIEEFFLRGQREGVFRPDVTATWLTEAFVNLVSGAGWSIQLGRAASRDFCRMITELMLHGARAPSRGNLPAPLAGFVGREAELDELEELIATSRLVTLTGIGGIGKSTLALQAARQRVADFDGGVWLIELGELSDGELLAQVAAAALGIRDQSTRPLAEVMVEALADRQALLVLDNCEHVLDATTQFVQTLLAGCPRLQILATSRELLDVDGESVLAVPPLPVPDTDHLPSHDVLALCDAVALFLKHARATQRSFQLTERNALAVARICNQLDGLPLAIELAAPLLRTMAVEQIAARISNRFKLLSHSKRGAPTRQQTPWITASAGATSAAPTPSANCGRGYRCSRAASNPKPSNTSAPQTWSTTNCSTRCAPWRTDPSSSAPRPTTSCVSANWPHYANTATTNSAHTSKPNCATATWTGTANSPLSKPASSGTANTNSTGYSASGVKHPTCATRCDSH